LFQIQFSRPIRTTAFVGMFVSLAVVAAANAEDTPPATAPPTQTAQILHAGQISVKFQDGELRYLRVGDREIIRRIYFSVREGDFATEMPKFSEMRVEPATDHFAIHLAAACTGKTISYNWTGDITGTSDGRIIYHASGSAPATGTSRRLGLCVLYGAGALAGHDFGTIGEGDQITVGKFPELVSPTLVASRFHTLAYSLDHLQVSCGIAESPFDMEDQRNYGDTSFKAYNPLPYPYPNIEKGKELSQTLTLRVDYAGSVPSRPTTASATQPADDAIHVRIGLPIDGARICAITSPDRFADSMDFVAMNSHRTPLADATAIAWKWTTATHLPDDDTAMENLEGIVHQAKTVRSFAPHALLRVGPISVNGRFPAVVRPPGFCAAWTAAAIKELSLANVDEAAFVDSTPQAALIISVLRRVAGKPVVDVSVSPQSGIEAFAVNDIGTTTLWLANRSAEPRQVVVDDLPPGAPPQLFWPAQTDKSEVLVGSRIKLAAYDICEIVIRR
jgi:hypothetical protein